jgi:hypothetical protein
LFDEAITQMYVEHEIDNRSDHNPIFMHLSINYDRFSITPHVFTSRLVWQRASNEDKVLYQESLRTYLSKITLPTEVLLCHNTECCHAEHDEKSSLYARNILEACLLAGETHIPVTRPASMAREPGWTEYVAPYREKSLFWHHMWRDNGRPKKGIIANIMRTTRAAYHNAIRSVNRNRADIVNERFADAILANNTRDFWYEAKRIRGVNASYTNNIDDLSSHDDIANMFASKYEELYSCVSFNEDDMNALKADIANHMGHEDINSECIVNAGEVRDAICKLIPGKGDGYLGLTSDHLINACDALSVHTAFLLTGMPVHGSVPRHMKVSTVIPIQKNRHANL